MYSKRNIINTEREGIIIGKRYQIMEIIGKGGYSFVYKVRDLNLDKIVAAKLFVGNHEFFQKELDNLRQIDSQYIPSLIDGFSEDGLDWIIMEYMEGRTLDNYIKNVPLNESKRRMIAEKIAYILMMLHNQNNPVVYGDLKPENILIDSDESIKLIDFGTASLASQLTAPDSLTPEYAAPELLAGVLLFQGDIYAFGAIWFYMITKNPLSNYRGTMSIKRLKKLGAKPFEAEMIASCLKINPEERIRDGQALYERISKKKFPAKEIGDILLSGILRILELSGICFSAYAAQQWFFESREMGKTVFSIGIGILLITYMFQKFIMDKRKEKSYIREAGVLYASNKEILLGIVIIIFSLSMIKANLCEKKIYEHSVQREDGSYTLIKVQDEMEDNEESI